MSEKPKRYEDLYPPLVDDGRFLCLGCGRMIEAGYRCDKCAKHGEG